MRKKMKVMGIKVTEMSTYLGFSRTTIYKYIDEYDQEKYINIDYKVKKVFDFIEYNWPTSKLQVIDYLIGLEKEKRVEELIIVKKGRAFQKEEKEKRTAELVLANKEVAFQKEEKEKRVEELIIVKKGRAFQKEEKEKRAAELVLANEEVAFQKEEKDKRVEELIKAGHIFENSIENAPLPIMIHAEDGTVLNISKKWSELSGYTKSDIPTIFDWTKKAYGKNEGEVLGFIKKIYELINVQHDEEFVVTTKDGRNIIWNFNSGYIGNLPDGRAVAMSVATDVTTRIAREREISYLSYHDSLTGLYNRRYYEEYLTKLDTPQNYPLTIVMSDINGLKLINDAFGHSAGDGLLISAANIISNSCSETDMVARIGGDEFVIVMPQTSGKETEAIIEKINNEAKQVNVESIKLSISFGFKTKYKINENIQEIYRSAEDLMYRAKLIEIPSMRSGAIETILNTLYEKDKSSEIHSRTVSNISEKLAVAYGMNRQQVNEVKAAGLLHDIGKIIIPITIITKKGKLTAKEYDIVKGHPEIGFRILNSTHDMRNISNIVLSHHERWDGLGYPRGIKAEDILLQSRMITIADAFDAMTSERTYRKVLSNHEALEEIINNAGTQFDPTLVQVFVKHFNTIIEINK